MSKVVVSITGSLAGMTRKEAVQLIEGCGAEFSKAVTYQTNYLVCADTGTNKAKRACEIGVEVISQHEFEACVDGGSFPKNAKPDAPKRWANNSFPVFDWVPIPPEEQRPQAMEYHDNDGEISRRIILFVATTEYQKKDGTLVQYARGVEPSDDGRHLKTYRMDRIVSLSELRDVGASPPR